MGAESTAKPAPGLGARLRSPIAASILGKGLEAFTLVFLVTLVPRLLGTADYGRFALATAVVAIASSSVGLGGPTLLSRFIPAAEPEKRAGLAYALIRRLIGLRIVQMLTFAAAGFVVAVVAPEHAPAAATGLIVLAVTLDVGATLAFQTALAFGRTSLWSFRWPLQNVLQLAVLPALYFAAGVLGAIASLSVAAGVVTILAVLSIRGRVAPPPMPLPPGILRFGLLQAASSVLVQARHRGGVFAVALLADSSAETGFAALAINIGLAATYAVMQIFTVELPRLSEELSGDPAGTLRSARVLSRNLTLVAIPVAVGCALLLDDVVPLLAGEGFEAGVDALAPALAAIPLAPLTAVASQLAALNLRPGTRLASNAVGIVVFAVTAALAVPAWGAAGGSAAFLAGVAATTTLGVLSFRRVMGLTQLAVAAAGTAFVLAVGVLL